MKIAITGHSAGIGLACQRVLSADHEIIGLSRSNGYDICNVVQVADAAESADVFINNAYCDYQQTYLLEEMFKRWRNHDKIIVSIGSACTAYPRIEQHLDSAPWPYRDHKRSLETLFRQLVKEPAACKLQLVSPGPVDTQMISHLNCSKLHPMDVAHTIKNNLGGMVKEMTLHA